MVSLREFGAHAQLFSKAGDDFGFCHLPGPVSVGDLAMVEGLTYRILEFADLRPGGAVDVSPWARGRSADDSPPTTSTNRRTPPAGPSTGVVAAFVAIAVLTPTFVDLVRSMSAAASPSRDSAERLEAEAGQVPQQA